jgi:dTDP-4-dehydrorhamnose 3,5-epimerase
MKFRELPLQGAFEIELEPRVDARGAFSRVFCTREFKDHGLETQYVQTNVSWNHKAGTLRGMHLQREPYGEVKVVRCTRGAVFDAIVDLRKNSPTFLRWTAVELTAEKRNAVYVPVGFAHGYQALTDDAEVFYMVSQYYQPAHEVGYRWNDPAWDIRWPLENKIVSEKDAAHKDFAV